MAGNTWGNTCYGCAQCESTSVYLPFTKINDMFFCTDCYSNKLSTAAYTGRFNIVSETDEKVNHPQHYGGDTEYETIKVIKAWGWGIPFCLANAVKYISRAEHKEKFVEDMEKAIWYCNEAIAEYKEKMESATDTQ
jgi:hypothetical protein